MDISDNPKIGENQWPNRNSPTGGDGTPVDGIECSNHMPDTYHVHVHLSIIVNGEAKSIPKEIGFVSFPGGTRCLYYMHTHDHSGKIHMEAEEQRSFTLGTFFHIWGQPLQSTNVAGYEGLPIRLFLVENDETVKEVPPEEWAGIELTTHRQLTFEIGTPIEEIPNFTWSAH